MQEWTWQPKPMPTRWLCPDSRQLLGNDGYTIELDSYTGPGLGRLFSARQRYLNLIQQSNGETVNISSRDTSWERYKTGKERLENKNFNALSLSRWSVYISLKAMSDPFSTSIYMTATMLIKGSDGIICHSLLAQHPIRHVITFCAFFFKIEHFLFFDNFI